MNSTKLLDLPTEIFSKILEYSYYEDTFDKVALSCKDGLKAFWNVDSYKFKKVKHFQHVYENEPAILNVLSFIDEPGLVELFASKNYLADLQYLANINWKEFGRPYYDSAVVANGHIECIKILEEEFGMCCEENINKYRPEHSETACGTAAECGQIDCLKYLLKIGYEVPDNVPMNVFTNDHIDCLQVLLENGSDIWDNYSDYKSSLCNGEISLEMFIYVYEHYYRDVDIHAYVPAKIEFIKYLNESGHQFTPAIYHTIIQQKNKECFQYVLLETNAGHPGEQEIIYAIQTKELDMVKYLLEHVKPNEMKSDIMHEAVSRKNMEIVKHLHDVEQIGFDDVDTNIAAGHGNLEMLKYLESMGAPITTEAYTWISKYSGKWSYKFPHYRWMYHAVLMYNATSKKEQKNYIECLDYLHAKNIPMNEEAFRIAAKSAEMFLVEFFHEHKCPSNKELFVSAVDSGDINIIKFLRKNGYPMSEEAFHCAISNYKNVEICQYLKDSGCPFTSKTFKQALLRNNDKIIECLYQGDCPLDIDYSSVTENTKEKILKRLENLAEKYPKN